MREKARKISPVLTALAALLRKAPCKGMIANLILRHLPRLGFSPYVSLGVGPYRFVLDADGPFHIFMIVRVYEIEIERLLRRVLKPGDTYVDVGAEVGYLAAVAGDCIGARGKMMLFEPDPRVFPILKEHMMSALENERPETVLVDCACSDSRNMFTLQLAPISGQSQLVCSGDEVRTKNTALVHSIVLDDKFDEESITHVRLLKMDVEGHEICALRGMSKSLSDGKVDFIVVEKNISALATGYHNPEHLHSMLAHYGYEGVHENGATITRSSIAGESVENLIYARNEELLREALPEYVPPVSQEAFSEREIEWYWRQVSQPNQPAIRGNKIVAKAKQGQLEEAIDEGLRLISEYPDLVIFRGHLAHWLLKSDRPDEARRHYEQVLRDNPNDKQVAEILKRLAG